MTDTNERQELQSADDDLGIVELDARLDMAFDPLASILTSIVVQANDCNNNCGRLKKF